MSVLHVFTVMYAMPWVKDDSQFRFHVAIPWDDVYEMYINQPETLPAMFALATAAAPGTSPAHLTGRIFDALRAIRDGVPAHRFGSVGNNDQGPYVLATTSAVFTRPELERYLEFLSPDEWAKAHAMGQRLAKMTAGLM